MVKVADPALGLRRIPRKEFEQDWSGYSALFDYTIAFDSELLVARTKVNFCGRAITTYHNYNILIPYKVTSNYMYFFHA